MIKEFKKIISNTCIGFTVFEFVLLIIAQSMLSMEKRSDAVVSFLNLKAASLLLLAIFVYNLVGLVFKIKSLSGAITRLIHYLLTMSAVFLVLVVIPGNFKMSFVIVFAFIFTLVYFIALLVSFALKKLFADKADSKKAYKPMFDTKDE